MSDLTIFIDVQWVSIALNTLGIPMLAYKLKKVMSSLKNKSFSKISVWMLVQLLVGVISCILLALAGIYWEPIINLIGAFWNSILLEVLEFII